MLNRYDFGSTVVVRKIVFNVRLDPELHADLTLMAGEQGRSLHNMVIYLLRMAVDQWKASRPPH